MPQRRHAARAALSGAAAAALISLATPAWASSTVPLHSAHRGSVAADFQQQCADTRFADRPPTTTVGTSSYPAALPWAASRA